MFKTFTSDCRDRTDMPPKNARDCVAKGKRKANAICSNFAGSTLFLFSSIIDRISSDTSFQDVPQVGSCFGRTRSLVSYENYFKRIQKCIMFLEFGRCLGITERLNVKNAIPIPKFDLITRSRRSARRSDCSKRR